MEHCTRKHVKYQVLDEDFLCPKCGAEAGDFYIDSAMPGECDLIHPDDPICCFKCGYATTGTAFTRRILKQKSMVTCPCCKGTGLVPKDKG